jgi:hypothetical protein
MVGERGFEPPTPWSRTRCSTRLSHSPNLVGGAHHRDAAWRVFPDAFIKCACISLADWLHLAALPQAAVRPSGGSGSLAPSPGRRSVASSRVAEVRQHGRNRLEPRTAAPAHSGKQWPADMVAPRGSSLRAMTSSPESSPLISTCAVLNLPLLRSREVAVWAG